MVAAVRAARYRLVFLSSLYLQSKACLSELEALRGQPGRTLFYVYTTQRNEQGAALKPPGEFVSQLIREGHSIRMLRQDEEIDCAALLRALIETGAMSTRMLKMPVLAAAQLASTASSEGDARFPTALHAQAEARRLAARPGGLGRCHEVAPQSATHFGPVLTPRPTAAASST